MPYCFTGRRCYAALIEICGNGVGGHALHEELIYETDHLGFALNYLGISIRSLFKAQKVLV